MMKRFLLAAIPLSAVAAFTQGEIITGSYPSAFIPSSYDPGATVDGYVEELDIYLMLFSTSHDFTTYTYFDTNWDLDGDFSFRTDTDSFVNPQFELGDVIAEGIGGSSLIGYSQDIGPDPVSVSMGTLGESLFIGFSINHYDSDDATIHYNYGFFEVVKEAEYDYRVIGWAYETEVDRDLTTFHLPAPSAIMLLGFGGLAAARRSR